MKIDNINIFKLQKYHYDSFLNITIYFNLSFYPCIDIAFTYNEPSRLSKLVVWLTQHELSEDPRDVITNFMIKLSSKFTVSTEYFGSFYLISHEIIKLILIFLLWKRKICAYPLTIISLKEAVHLLKEAFTHLLDVRLEDAEIDIIKAAINKHANLFCDFHNLGTRKSGNFKYNCGKTPNKCLQFRIEYNEA